VLHAHEPQLTERDVHVRIEGPLPPVYADPDLLGEVLDNLVVNAIKYACGGASPELRFYALGDEREWVLAIADRGPGIPDAYIDRVFEVFERATEGEEGAGIGLAIVKRVIEVHGGRVWVEPTPGGGSTFYLALPREPGEAPAAERSTPPPASSPGSPSSTPADGPGDSSTRTRGGD
jgi:signal transduction histidine kinase